MKKKGDLGCFGLGAAVGAAAVFMFAKKKEMAAAEKVLIVRDGSVEATVSSHAIGQKQNGKQKWPPKAKTVSVHHSSPNGSQPMNFDTVELIVRDQSGVNHSIIAENSGFPAALHLTMPSGQSGWEFRWVLDRYLLQDQQQTAVAKLVQVIVWHDGNSQTFSHASGQPNLFVLFKAEHPLFAFFQDVQLMT